MRALVLLTLLATQAFEQRVDVHYIEVPVTVIAKDGTPVRGLNKANFELRDDAAIRTIESFEAIDYAAAETAKAISPLHPASRRNFLLLFDLSYSNPTSIARAQNAARNFIARSIGGRDLVAVGTIDVDRGFRFITAFTTDRELLTAAIADPRNYRSPDPLQIAGSATIDAPIPSTNAGERESIALEELADVARLSSRLDDAFNRTRVKKQVAMLASVARSLQKLGGRKHLVLLSEGFDPRLVEGRAAEEGEEAAEENRAVSVGEVWKVDSDKRFGSAGHQRDLAAMAESFRRADVILHAVDIQGVRVQNDVRGGAKLNSNGGLFLLANATGGTVFQNSNDISSEFDKLTRQHEVVYILGFHAPIGRAGEFHELKLRLLHAPAGARVQHRGGYYDAGSESNIERALTTAEIIVNDLPADEIKLAGLAAPFHMGGEKAQVPVVLEIDGDTVIQHAKNDTATADIFVYAFDEDGIVRDSLHQRVVLDLAKVRERLSASGIRFYGTLQLHPGAYAIKNLVRVIESDAKGYKRVELVIPRARDVAVQAFAMSDAGPWLMIKASRDSAATPYPFVISGEPFIPATRAAQRFALFVYNADPDELTVDVTPHAKLEKQSDGEDVTKYVFAIDSNDARDFSVVVRKKGSADERRVSVSRAPR